MLAELNDANRDHEQVDPLRERISTRWDWASVDWSEVATARWDATPGVVWKTASEVCAAVGIDRPTKPETSANQDGDAGDDVQGRTHDQACWVSAGYWVWVKATVALLCLSAITSSSTRRSDAYRPIISHNMK